MGNSSLTVTKLRIGSKSVFYANMNWLEKITQMSCFILRSSSSAISVGVITLYLLSTGTVKPFTAERWWVYQEFQAGSTYGANIRKLHTGYEARNNKCSVHMLSPALGLLSLIFHDTDSHKNGSCKLIVHVYKHTDLTSGPANAQSLFIPNFFLCTESINNLHFTIVTWEQMPFKIFEIWEIWDTQMTTKAKVDMYCMLYALSFCSLCTLRWQ